MTKRKAAPTPGTRRQRLELQDGDTAPDDDDPFAAAVAAKQKREGDAAGQSVCSHSCLCNPATSIRSSCCALNIVSQALQRNSSEPLRQPRPGTPAQTSPPYGAGPHQPRSFLIPAVQACASFIRPPSSGYARRLQRGQLLMLWP